MGKLLPEMGSTEDTQVQKKSLIAMLTADHGKCWKKPGKKKGEQLSWLPLNKVWQISFAELKGRINKGYFF